MDYGEIVNQIGRTFEVQALYQQSLLQSELETKQAAARLAAQRRQRELSVQESPEAKPEAGADMELSHRQSALPKYGPGRHLDIQV